MADGKKVAKDTYLFREGDAPDAMYIVKSGMLAVTKTKGTSEVVLAEIGPGSMVGEMAIFDKKPRSANVKAMKDSEVISLPYEGLNQQMDSLPVWVKAIMRTMNENLREANKKIKMLETPNQEEDRFPPHVVNKLLSLVNFVGHKYGKPEEGGISIPSGTLRRYTIQIFQEATNKMNSMTAALKTLGYMTIEDLGEGRQKMINLQADYLFEFVDWYNDWLFSSDKEKVSLRDEEVKVLEAVLHFASKVQPDAKGFHKINVNDVQNDSMKELGRLVRIEELNVVIEKKLVSEKIMEESGVYVTVNPADVNKMCKNWALINNLKKHLR
ncbi:Crp/Fnr family transcriptional regulator [Bdellovibrio sp. HCB337]|uniref:Crp/Fnr family transcriptional regulator n=1 Tax=Bdellovibrio sp. HCB337 TaxID=3394358 RepID=UPI0039A4A42A